MQRLVANFENDTFSNLAMGYTGLLKNNKRRFRQSSAVPTTQPQQATQTFFAHVVHMAPDRKNNNLYSCN